MKVIKWILYKLGLIECLHTYTKWKIEICDQTDINTGRKFPNTETGKQRRTCTKCNLTQKEWI